MEGKSESEQEKREMRVVWPWEADPSHWKEIETRLTTKTFQTPEELQDEILFISKDEIHSRFFSGYYSAKPSLKDHFFQRTLPFLQKLVVRGPQLLPKIPLHIPRKKMRTELSREQVACIIANAFLGTFSFYSPTLEGKGFAFPHLDFAFFLGGLHSVPAMECMLNYFNRIEAKMPKGKLIIRRAVLNFVPDWENSSKPIRTPALISSEGTIEGSPAGYHADFANEYIGGGVLTGGNVQEEILFVIKPECLVSLLFCARMEKTEAITITGAERFSSYTGYGGSWQWGGDYVDPTPVEEDGTLKRTIIAYDAIVAFSRNAQFETLFVRDLNKALIAFTLPEDKDDSPTSIATGNWGCGAFGGDKQLKAFQQLMAASEVERDLLYFTFKDKALEEKFSKFCQLLKEKNLTVGQLYKVYIDNLPAILKSQSVFEAIEKHLQK